MITPVALGDLEAALRERGGTAYVVTVNDSTAPHVVLAEVVRSGTTLIADVGERTASYARSRPHVSLVYPVRHPSDYSLIVDARATVATTPAGARLHLAPTRAVLHRPAGASAPVVSACGSDCVPLSLEDPR